MRLGPRKVSLGVRENLPNGDLLRCIWVGTREVPVGMSINIVT